MKSELLSDNLMLIIDRLLLNQNLCKYLYYDTATPLTGDIIADTSTLLLDKVFPYPFDPNVETEGCSTIRVYYPDGTMENVVIGDIKVFVDIVVARDLWLIKANDKRKIRPYEIMREVLTSLDDISIATVGQLHFRRFNHIYVNSKFDCIRLMAPMMTIEK